MVPPHVALQYLHHIVVVAFAQAAVLLDVAEFEELELELAKPFGEGDLLSVVQMLSRKDQQTVFEPDVIEGRKFRIADFRQLNAAHGRAETGVERGYIERHHRVLRISVPN